MFGCGGWNDRIWRLTIQVSLAVRGGNVRGEDESAFEVSGGTFSGDAFCGDDVNVG